MGYQGRLWLVGCGNMGGAMLRGWIADGLDPTSVTVIDPFVDGLPDGVRVVRSAEALAGEQADLLLLAVKPQLLDDVTPAIAPLVGAGTVMLSILAGVEVDALRTRFPAAQAVVRIMPNTPAAIGKGVLALFGDSADMAVNDRIAAMMRPLGLVEWIAAERLFDAVTALSGCGPAFVFRFIDAMAQAGAALGLPDDQAARFALATVEGAALLAAQAGESPAILADRVASPGGSTREGMNRLDRDGDLFRLLAETLDASARRNAEMAAAARG
jgi:pyrroline-5-carboxylate reductase